MILTLMPGDGELYIIYDDEITEDINNPFVIPEEIGKFDKKDKKELFFQLSQFEISCKTEKPLYQIMWPHVVLQSRGNLLEYIILFQRLEQRIKTTSPDLIYCYDVPEKYHSVIIDIAEEYNIQTDINDRRSKLKLYYTVISSALLFLIDQILFLPYRKKQANIKTIMYVYGGKIGKISDVINHYDEENMCLVTWLNVRYLLDSVIGDRMSGINVLPINSLVGIRELKDEFIFFIDYIKEIQAEQMVRDLDNRISDQTGAKMKRTVRQSVWYAYKNDIRMVLTGIAAGRLQRKYSVESVLYHGPSPRERTIMKESDCSVEQYYLPHGIGGTEEPIPDQEVTQFVPGTVSIRYLQKVYSSNIPNLVDTGLPHLSNYYENHGSKKGVTDTNRLLIATQPYDDPIRKKFIKITLKTIAQSSISGRVIIKCHPIEDSNFYRKLLNDSAISRGLDVVVTEHDLIRHIKQSSLTITMTSNVGLESIIHKTPCVSIIPWDVLTPPIYVRQGPVPYITTRNGANDFFSKLDSEAIGKMLDKQHDFVMGNFSLRKDSAREICEQLQ